MPKKQYPKRYFNTFDGTFTKSYTEQDWLDEINTVMVELDNSFVNHVSTLINELPDKVQKLIKKIPSVHRKLIEPGLKAAKKFLSDTKTGDFFYQGLKRFLPKKVIKAIEDYQTQMTDFKIKQISQRLIDGKITLSDWQSRIRDELKKAHLKSAIFSRGGVNQMRDKDYLAVGRNLKQEYRYLRQLAKDVSNGKVSEKQFMMRSRMYGKKTRLSGETMKQEKAALNGAKYMQRFLHGGDRSCPDCVKYAGQGKVLIGELPLPKEKCMCKANCRCRVEYS